MASKVIDEKFAAIVDAVCYWMGYQFKIGRDQLIHEASLRYPIADTITSTGVAINRLVLEKLHPVFKSKKIDLVIYDEDATSVDQETSDDKLREVYEFKLAKKETNDEFGTEHQRVFDDFVRLAYYNLWRKKECYFLMCGKYDDFKTYFIGQSNKIVVDKTGKNSIAQLTTQSSQLNEDEWRSGGLYGNWFGFSLYEEKTIAFNESSLNNWGLKTFQDSYSLRNDIKETWTKSISVKSTCMAITPAGLGKDRTHAAGIWKIEGAI